VRQKRFAHDPTGFERLSDMWIGNILGRAGRDGGFYQGQAFRRDLFPDDPETRFKGADIRIAAFEIPQVLLDKITLDIHN